MVGAGFPLVAAEDPMGKVLLDHLWADVAFEELHMGQPWWDARCPLVVA